jgi:hypothetical protein
MAVRYPLKLDTGDHLREMSSSELESVRLNVALSYCINPSVSLSVVSSGGNLGKVQEDWRFDVGVMAQSVRPLVESTVRANNPLVGVQAAVYSTINQNVGSESQISDTGSIRFPVYYDGSDIRAMNRTDFYDTFIYPAISSYLMQGGFIYTTSTSTSTGTHYRVSTTPIHQDTRWYIANQSSYGLTTTPLPVSSGVFFRTENRTYLLQRDQSANFDFDMMYINENGSNYLNLDAFDGSDFETIARQAIRYAVLYQSGYRLRYQIDGHSFLEDFGNSTGVSCGGIVDTAYNMVPGPGMTGIPSYFRYQVNADDYRAQLVPNASYGIATRTSFLRQYSY